MGTLLAGRFASMFQGWVFDTQTCSLPLVKRLLTLLQAHSIAREWRSMAALGLVRHAVSKGPWCGSFSVCVLLGICHCLLLRFGG